MSNESNAPDLTAAEARAEVEAFLGPVWDVRVVQWPNGIAVEADRPGPVYVSGPCCPTYRAAVDALLQAWRDAVRPWVRSGVLCGGADSAETTDEINTITSRVLKEDS